MHSSYRIVKSHNYHCSCIINLFKVIVYINTIELKITYYYNTYVTTQCASLRQVIDSLSTLTKYSVYLIIALV